MHHELLHMNYSSHHPTARKRESMRFRKLQNNYRKNITFAEFYIYIYIFIYIYRVSFGSLIQISQGAELPGKKERQPRILNIL